MATTVTVAFEQSVGNFLRVTENVCSSLALLFLENPTTRTKLSPLFEASRNLKTSLNALTDIYDTAIRENTVQNITSDLKATSEPLMLQLGIVLNDLKEFLEAYRLGFRKVFRIRTLWLLTESQVQQLLKRIVRCNDGLHMSILLLTSLATSNQKAILEKKLNGILSWLQEKNLAMKADDRCKTLVRWLAAPDPSLNHEHARRTRILSTGSWFTESAQFKEWVSTSSSTLWLYGPPGCGKTVLCSKAIDEVMRNYPPNACNAVTYFYFDFQDDRKQSVDSLIRSLMQQLSFIEEQSSRLLDGLYEDCRPSRRQPTYRELTEALLQRLHEFSTVYIMVDAVDECKEFEKLLDLLQVITKSGLKNLHLLATSRPKRQIRFSFNDLSATIVPMAVDKTSTNDDILNYLEETLRNDQILQKWPKEVLEEVKTKLQNGAGGIFRWVKCQLGALRKCTKISDVRQTLESLPTTLDGTYERILASITDTFEKEALTLLQWLTYSRRALRIEEIAEALAIEDCTNGPRLNPDNRLLDSLDTLMICPDLVVVSPNEVLNEDGDTVEVQELRFAHFSVKEYLTSSRCCAGVYAKYSIQPKANNVIAESCIGYLFSITINDLLKDDFHSCFPLSRYASREWFYHAQGGQQGHDRDRLDQMIAELLNQNDHHVVKWLIMYDPDRPWSTSLNPHKKRRELCSALYYASSIGLLRTVKQLINQDVDVNQIGGSFGSPLQAAAYHGHEDVVSALLNNGANCMIRCGHYGTALQAAKFAQHESIVRILEDYDVSETASNQLPSHIQLLPLEKEPFEVIDKIGGGGSGVVEKVRSLSDGRICVRKTCRTPTPTTKKRFFDEVRIMQKLHHQHVVKVFNSYGRGKTSSLLLLPLADMDLGDFMESLEDNKSGDVDLRTEGNIQLLIQWTICLAEGLKYIHSKKVRHKDIKPHNLLVHGKNILYTDFGIAHEFEGSVSVTAGSTGMTRRYSAPEVVAGDERSRSADVFSLGCVYVEMLGAISRRSLFEDFDSEDDYATYINDNRAYIAERLANTRSMAETLSPHHFLSFPKVPELTTLMLAASPQVRPKALTLAEELCTKDICEDEVSYCCHQGT